MIAPGQEPGQPLRGSSVSGVGRARDAQDLRVPVQVPCAAISPASRLDIRRGAKRGGAF